VIHRMQLYCFGFHLDVSKISMGTDTLRRGYPCHSLRRCLRQSLSLAAAYPRTEPRC